MAPAVPFSASDRPAESPGPLVLVVDDDDSVRRITVRILQRFGCQAIGLRSVEEALDLLADPESEAKAVVLDWSLPGLCGAPAVRALREVSADLSLVVVTGWAHEVEDALAKEWSSVPVLHKPFEPERLIEVLSEQGLSTA